MEPPPKRRRADRPVFRSRSELEAALPPPWREDERLLQLRCATLAARANGRAPLAVVDDDPTGTQTAHSVPVLADWSEATLAPVLGMDRPCFYLLANTRALPEDDAVARAEEIGRNIQAAASRAGVGPLSAVVSRGDSCLRGHYPVETDALARGLGWGVQGGDVEAPTVVLAPFFAEGGRLTAGDVHYVAGPAGSDTSRQLTPVGETEFARDRAFGFTASVLPDWVAEKHSGGEAPQVISVDLQTIRRGGPKAVAELLVAAPAGCVVVANAVVPRDMQVFALGSLMAELARGPTRPILYRSAGALVAARAALPPRPLLTSAELAAPPVHGAGCRPGLVVVGSYVGKSSEQLATLLQLCTWLAAVEVRVAEFVENPDAAGAAETNRASALVLSALGRGESVVLHTSREVMQDDGAGGLRIGARVADALCRIVQESLSSARPPGFLVAKGGITSNDVAVKALGVRRAEVLGAVVPGVPVWRCGPETRAPGLAYVVFPGNVGLKDDLARVARKMAGRDEESLETRLRKVLAGADQAVRSSDDKLAKLLASHLQSA